MSRKKKEGTMSAKPVRRTQEKEGVYETRYDGVRAKPPSRRKKSTRQRDSWHPEALRGEEFDMSDREPELTLDELELIDSINTHLAR